MNKRKSEIVIRNHTRAAAVALCFLFCFIAVFPQPGLRAQGKTDPELQKIFKQMESAGKTFRSLSAKISQKTYTAVLKQFGETETGEVYVARAKDGSTMLRQEIKSPVVKILTIKGDVATAYQPGIKQARIVNLGKNKDKASELMSVGIGQPPADLLKNYDVTYQGDESVEGAPCAVLLLKPRNSKLAAYFSDIVLWVKKSSGIPIQHKLKEPNRDYQLVTFSDEKLNLRIPDSKFEQKLPGDVEKLRY